MFENSNVEVHFPEGKGQHSEEKQIEEVQQISDEKIQVQEVEKGTNLKEVLALKCLCIRSLQSKSKKRDRIQRLAKDQDQGPTRRPLIGKMKMRSQFWKKLWC